MRLRVLFLFVLICFTALFATAQELALPTPERVVIHSKILNEDRVIWVRTPPGYQQSKNVYPVLYQTDAPTHVNEIGGTIDFLVENDRLPQLIVVGIENTDRTRDLTPSHPALKEGEVDNYPTSGGANRFLDFIQTELMPEIEKRYRTAPYRVFAGHSLGGLFAIHALITRPELFNAYIAVSPSLQFDSGRTLHEAQQFFATRGELKKTLFFSLANEGNTPNPMGENFDELRKTLEKGVPKGFAWGSERFPEEDHGSTLLLSHYAGLRKLFSDWRAPRDEKGVVVGELAGLEEHYRKISEHYGYRISVPEQSLNLLGYQLMALKKPKDAIVTFQRNLELYPESANVYDSLGEALEGSGDIKGAAQNFQKAIDLGTKTHDASLASFKSHLERVTTQAKPGQAK